MKVLDLEKWELVRTRGRRSYVLRASIVVALIGFFIAMWGTYEFFSAGLRSVGKVLEVGGSLLPLFSAVLHAATSNVTWRLNERL